MDTVTVYMETVYNSSNSTNSTRNLNKNRKKSNIMVHISETKKDFDKETFSDTYVRLEMMTSFSQNLVCMVTDKSQYNFNFFFGRKFCVK